MSDQKQNRLSFGQKFFCLLDEGVSHFVNRLDSFCTYLSSIVDSIYNIRNIFVSLSVDLEYVATSLCSLLSNTGFFASFPMHLGGQKTRFRL